MKNSSMFILRLKDLMYDNGLSVNKLAKAIPCDNQAIARWLEGKYYPRHYILIKLADYFHCSVDFLLGVTNDETPLKNNKIEIIDFQTQFRIQKAALALTDYQIAKKLEIEQSTISKWLIRNQVPETSSLIKLSSIFDCSVEFLLGRTDS